MPVEDHAVHEKVKQKEGFRYGCWNLPRPMEGQRVVGMRQSLCDKTWCEIWTYVFSTNCRFDMSLKDPACEGCEHRGSGEKYAEEIRRNGK